MHSADPRGYMQLVKALQDGSNDVKNTNSDTESVDPDEWFDHFSTLLGKAKNPVKDKKDFKSYIDNNCEDLVSELDEPFTIDELKLAVRNLKNNKSGSFDLISNEMIKCSFMTLSNQYKNIFNSILSSNCYPNVWKQDILKMTLEIFGG